MFNVIKGELINRNINPVIIKDGQRKEVAEAKENINNELSSMMEELEKKNLNFLN